MELADILKRNDIPNDVKQFISENINIEKAVQEFEQRFNDFAHIIPHLMFEIDLNGNFTFINRNGLDSFGYTYNEIKIQGINFLKLFSEKDTKRLVLKMKEILNNGKNDNQEYDALKKDGRIFPVSIVFSIIEYEGKPIGFRGIICDRTDTKKVRMQAQSLDFQEKKFREDVSYKLRTTLTNIKGFIEIMQTREKLSQKQYETCIDYINKNIQKLIILATEFSGE